MISQTANNVGQYLRERAYPGRDKAKRLARDLGCSVSTAKLLLAGRSVSAWMDRLAQRWGWAFLAAVYRPRTDELAWDAACARDLDGLALRLAALEAELGQLRETREGSG